MSVARFVENGGSYDEGIMTPKQAVNIQCRFCKNQMNFDCDTVCKLYRTDLTPLKKIRLHCLDCAGASDEVKACDGIINRPDKISCSLWAYRLGKNPKRKGIGKKGGNPDIRTIPKKVTDTRLTDELWCLNRVLALK